MALGIDVFTALAMRDGTSCYICGLQEFDDDPLEIEHFYPRHLGGSNELENLRLAHRSCNRTKGISAVCPKGIIA